MTPDPVGLDASINLFGYAGSNPLNEIDPLGLASGLWEWPVNGNRWPGYTRQDWECSSPSQALNKNKCTKKCCIKHDKCYEKYGCNFSSWLPGVLIGPCQMCNMEAVVCIMINISKKECGECNE